MSDSDLSMPFPVQASILSEPALRHQILTRYPQLSANPECVLHKYGVNDTYRITDKNQYYYLRIYTPLYADREAIQREITLLLTLEDSGLSVAAPIADRDGKYLQTIDAPEDRRFAVLFTNTLGTELSTNDPDQLLALGEWTARFHTLTDTIELPGVRSPMNTQRMVDDNLSRFLPRLSHREDDVVFVNRLANKLTHQLGEMNEDTVQDIGTIHGDLHAGNSHYHDSHGIQVFDFADSGVGWRLYDLGCLLYSIRITARQKRARTKLWAAFIRGYRHHRGLPMDIHRQTLLFVMLKHFWLLGFHTTMTLRHGDAWMNERYLDGAMNALKQLENEYHFSDPLPA